MKKKPFLNLYNKCCELGELGGGIAYSNALSKERKLRKRRRQLDTYYKQYLILLSGIAILEKRISDIENG